MSSSEVICGHIFRNTMGMLTFKCTNCPCVFEMISEYAMHLDQHFQLVTIPVQTDFSDQISSSGDFKQKLQHSPADVTIVKIENYLPEPEFQSVLGLPIADVPPLTTQPKLNSLKRRPASDEFKAKYVPKRIKGEPVKLTKITPSKKLAHTFCKYCRKKFKLESSLIAHQEKFEQTTTGILYKCTDCPKSFSSGCTLDVHHKSVHIYGRKKFPCNMCPKMYRTQAHLVAHQTTHSGSEPYKCDICHKSYPNRFYIAIHMRLHTGEKPYQCTMCGDRFITSSYLSWHMRKHNGDLRRHKCAVCGKAFRSPSALKEHHRVHTGERPLSCEVCGKTFSMARNMRTHVLLHSGIKPYPCRYCEIKFTQPSNRRQHERLKHEQHLDDLAL